MSKEIEMTPLKVELLLWYYCSNEDHPNYDAPAVQQAIEEFCQAGIFYRRPVETASKIGTVKPALEAYVSEILSIPLPRQIWVCNRTYRVRTPKHSPAPPSPVAGKCLGKELCNIVHGGGISVCYTCKWEE